MRPTIVCIEDELIVLRDLEKLLKKEFEDSFSIEAIENSGTAIEIIKKMHRSDVEIPLIISDHIMPQINGDKLLIEIHSLYPDSEKILLTGHADLNAVANIINNAKLSRYITKPWEEKDLIMAVKQAISIFYNNRALDVTTAELTRINKELSKKINIFYKFVPAEFLNFIKQEHNEKHIGLDKYINKEMTILFSDIRNFTGISEKLSLSDNYKFLNTYLKLMNPIIKNNNGFIDKFIGDATMALFPAATDAINAGIEMVGLTKDKNNPIYKKFNIALKFGIGINTGDILLGTIGDKSRMQTTVIGDAINLASRVESLTKTYNHPILITENTKLKISKNIDARIIDNIKIKGKTGMFPIYRINI